MIWLRCGALYLKFHLNWKTDVLNIIYQMMKTHQQCKIAKCLMKYKYFHKWNKLFQLKDIIIHKVNEKVKISFTYVNIYDMLNNLINFSIWTYLNHIRNQLRVFSKVYPTEINFDERAFHFHFKFNPIFNASSLSYEMFYIWSF